MSLRRNTLLGFIALLALLPQLPVPEFWITQANYIGLYTLVVIGLVLLTGVAGLTSFGQANKRGLAKRCQTRHAGEQHQAYDHQGVQADVIGLRDPKLRHRKLRQQRQ